MGQFTGLIRGRGANVAQSGFVSFGDVSLVESVCSVLYVYRKIIVFVCLMFCGGSLCIYCSLCRPTV